IIHKITEDCRRRIARSRYPKKRLFGTAKDSYYNYLRQYGQPVADYKWSGYVLATLLPYLEEQHQITLMNSPYEEREPFLTDSRNGTHCLFTNAHKKDFLAKLDAEFSEIALREYYNEF